MVAVPLAPKSEAFLVASPAYLETRSVPSLPSDLLDHRAVVCRSQVSGLIIPWTLQPGGETVQIAPRAATIVHDLASQIKPTVRGLGILSAPAASVSDLIDAGKLSRVLPSWSSPLEALYLYFPSRRHQSAALRAFVAFLTSLSYLPSHLRHIHAKNEDARDEIPPCTASNSRLGLNLIIPGV
jgi:DNA-binding transcriptional LysR family regulator